MQVDRNAERVGPLKLETNEILISMWYPPIDLPFKDNAGFYAHRVFNQRFPNHG
jgi:hypothetical protein